MQPNTLTRKFHQYFENPGEKAGTLPLAATAGRGFVLPETGRKSETPRLPLRRVSVLRASVHPLQRKEKLYREYRPT
jgi:hypothetical protein